MLIGTGTKGQGIILDQFIAVVAIHMLLQPAQQEGGNEGHAQVANHLNGSGREIEVIDTCDISVESKELCKPDDKHNRGIFDIDDKVVADLRNDVTESLGQNNIGHNLHVRHADGLGPFGLAGVHGDNAAPDGFRHIGACVDGDNEDSCHPNTVKPHGVVAEIRQAVVNEHRLKHHGGTPKDLHINADQHPN